MAWTFVATNRAGVSLGEVRQSEARGFRRSLNRGRSARGTIRTSNSLAGNVLAGDVTLIKAYDDRAGGAPALRHNGPVTGSNKAVDERGTGKITWTSNDPSWRLLTRLIGKSLVGASFGDALNLMDRGTVMGQIINALNRGDLPGGPIYATKDDTGIRVGNITPSGRSYFGPWRWFPAASAFAQLSSGIDSPDYDLLPTEPTPDADGVQIATLVAAPSIGQVRQDAVFEFGAGKKNVKTFEIVSDGGIVANDVAHLPSGFPDNAMQAVIEQTDAASIAARGLHEDALTEEVLTDALRTALVADHLAVRKQPRRTIAFTLVRDPDPFGLPLAERRVPRPFADYDVGDVVPFRATELVEVYDPVAGRVTGYAEAKTVDAYFRVFTMDITINNDGSEDVALTFVEEA
jgi:hypothetical protein